MGAELVTITAPRGRQIEVLTAGPPEGRPLVLHNGTPGGAVAFQPMVDTAASRGLRTIICARPGYGKSTPQPGRLVTDVADDVSAVLAAFGSEQFVTVGWSGGGPHALACAARLAGRCLAAASMAGVAPWRADGLDWLAGMGPENVTEFSAAQAGEAELTAFLETHASVLAGVTGDQVAESFGALIDTADAKILTGEFAEYQAASFRASVSQGVAGWRDDDLAFMADWGFSMADAGTGAPVAVWQGDQDRMVPVAHGAWLAAHVPGARAHILPGEGHLTLSITRYGEILDELLDLAAW